MLPHSPPVPVAATYDKVPARLVVTFDRELRPGLTNADVFGVRWQNFRRPDHVAATVLGRTATATMANPFAQVGADVLDYSAAFPQDIRSIYDVPAAAFANYPLVAG